MHIKVDTHTHTIASGHAYSTIREMAKMAADKGLEGLALTEHAMEMPGTCHAFYFENLRVMPREMYDIKLLFGVEANIMDEQGTIDMPERQLKQMDIAIASIHIPCYGKTKGIEANTNAYLKAMDNPLIDIIGHPDDGRFEIDYPKLVKKAKETGTILEINNSSLKPNGYRKGAYENDMEMLKLCKEEGVMITMGSDAHVDVDIANASYSMKVIEDAEFPEELIVNTSIEKLMASLKRYK